MSNLMHWPDSLPLPLLSGHGYTPGANLVDSVMASGYPRSRRVSKSAPDIMPVKFLFTAGEAALFEGWFHHSIGDGQDWFLMKVKVPSGLIEHEVKFKSAGQKITAVSATLWKKDAVLWVKRREIISEELTVLLQEYKLSALERSARVSNEIEL
jgi:hypothetical protein